MKASEVLRRYANGKRDFRLTDIRGESFEGQDLSGADFHGADIRGANFTNTNLREANFTDAKAGVQSQWLCVQQILAFVLSAIFGALAAFLGGFIPASLVSNNNALLKTILENLPVAGSRHLLDELSPLIAAVVCLALVINALIALIRQGFTVRSVYIIVSGFILAIVSIIAVLISGIVIEPISSATGSLALLIAVSIGFVSIFVSVIVSVAAIIAAGFTTASVSGITASVSILILIAYTGAVDAKAISTSIVVLIGIICVIIIFLLNLYMGMCALKKDEKFVLVHSIGVAFGAIGGTSFCGSNLTHANFSNAILKGSNFSSSKQKQTLLTHVYWEGAKQLDKARRGNSMLSSLAVCELLVTRNGYKKSYNDTDLRGANLNGVNLNEANLKRAILSDATFVHAELRNADLTETLALGTDFSGALLTGACLEAWNIDDTTKLDNVDCQYVFLKGNRQERRPSSGDFAPREFTKLFQEVLSTVDLIFRNGIDWKAFEAALRQVQIKKEDTPLEIQSIENKGDGMVVVRVKVPPDANKEEIHREFNQQYEFALKALEARYQAELQAKEGEIARYRKDSANMWEVIKLQAKKPVHVQAIAEAKSMNNSTDQSQDFNVGGNFNINATNAVVSLRDISGNVTNTINQLPESSNPDQPDLKQLLMQLKEAIETDSDLPFTDKADLLEQVQNLVEAKQSDEPEQKESLARKAKKMFEATLKSLPDTARIVEACSKLLPLILKALGLPA